MSNNIVEKKPSFIRRNGSFVAFLIGMSMLGFLAQFQWIGQLFIAIYAIVAIRRRMSSGITFTAALLALAMVPLAIITANWLVAQNFAAYAFVLFVFGMIGMTLDLRRDLSENK